MNHDTSHVAKRRLAGRKRDEAKKALRHDTAASHRNKLYADPNLDSEAIAKGNLTAIQSLLVFRKAKSEVSLK